VATRKPWNIAAYYQAVNNIGRQLGLKWKQPLMLKGPGGSTKSGRKTIETGPVTAEKDVRVTYRKRRMPRKKKRRYVRSVKRFRSMRIKELPARIFQYVYTEELGSVAGFSRYFGGFMGLFGVNYYDNNLGEVWNSITNSTAADDKARAGRLRVDHMGLTILLRNKSAENEPPIDIDVYKVVCTRDIPIGSWAGNVAIESMHAGLKSDMRQAQGMDIEVDDGGTGIATVQENAGTSSTNQVVGDTLFNAPPFLHYWKILKVWKVYLPVGNTVQFNWRDSRNHRVAYKDCFTPEVIAAKAGLTKGYIFNVNGRFLNATETGGDAQFVATSLMMEQYVRYNVKVLPSSSPTLVYDGI